MQDVKPTYTICFEYLQMIINTISTYFRGGRSFAPAAGATGLVPDDRTDALENVTRTIGNLLDGYDIRLRPNFGGLS